LERNPPILWVPEDKDKERFPHWVSFHPPVVVEWLEPYISRLKNDKIAFSYYSMQKMLDELNVKAVHTGRKIAFSYFRKLFEQMCNNVLVVRLPDERVVPAMHPRLRDYIMSHNTGSLDIQSYDGKLPSEIYEQYL
jgi:hypothetical protein